MCINRYLDEFLMQFRIALLHILGNIGNNKNETNLGIKFMIPDSHTGAFPFEYVSSLDILL